MFSSVFNNSETCMFLKVPDHRQLNLEEVYNYSDNNEYLLSTYCVPGTITNCHNSEVVTLNYPQFTDEALK